MLPDASADRDARLLVFTGRTGRWKGIFAVHSWVVYKREGATAWTRYDVVGWGNPVRMNGWAPDGRWYGNVPRVLVDLKGDAANALIPRMQSAIEDYRYRNNGDYRMWPGPNSNTFVAAVLRAVPELTTTLPPNAIGKDFRDGFYAGLTDSRTGVELSLFGVGRHQGRLGRRPRAQHARTGRRPRPAAPRGEAAGLRPDRHRQRNRDRRAGADGGNAVI